MSSLDGQKVVLGVSGGIAAYKAVEVCRRLVDLGAHVAPIMTNSAHRFIGEVTLSALASEPVQQSLWGEDTPIPHTRLGQTADLVVICPATARLIADYAAGRSGDLLTATLLATRAPVVVCPAMHTEMWEHPAVQDNLEVLRRRGVHIVEPESGRLAGGDMGHGRLADPSVIADAVAAILASSRDLAGLRVLVTAGGTREPVDPVRFLGNRSSGKQGHALAAAAAARGASVTLITTSDLPVPAGVESVRVETADQMHMAVSASSTESDVIVMAAAVADFKPATVVTDKLKKADGVPGLRLEPTVDILAELGKNRTEGQTLVGFAAETADVARNARSKLESKRVDLLVANDVSELEVGFGHDTNAVTIYSRDEEPLEVGLADKLSVANAVLDAVVARRLQSPGSQQHSA